MLQHTRTRSTHTASKAPCCSPGGRCSQARRLPCSGRSSSRPAGSAAALQAARTSSADRGGAENIPPAWSVSAVTGRRRRGSSDVGGPLAVQPAAARSPLAALVLSPPASPELVQRQGSSRGEGVLVGAAARNQGAVSSVPCSEAAAASSSSPVPLPDRSSSTGGGRRSTAEGGAAGGLRWRGGPLAASSSSPASAAGCAMARPAVPDVAAEPEAAVGLLSGREAVAPSSSSWASAEPRRAVKQAPPLGQTAAEALLDAAQRGGLQELTGLAAGLARQARLQDPRSPSAAGALWPGGCSSTSPVTLLPVPGCGGRGAAAEACHGGGGHRSITGSGAEADKQSSGVAGGQAWPQQARHHDQATALQPQAGVQAGVVGVGLGMGQRCHLAEERLPDSARPGAGLSAGPPAAPEVQPTSQVQPASVKPRLGPSCAAAEPADAQARSSPAAGMHAPAGSMADRQAAAARQAAPVLVVAYLDYTSKYGTGWLLSDGTCGVLFNDRSQMLLPPGEAPEEARAVYMARSQAGRGTHRSTSVHAASMLQQHLQAESTPVLPWRTHDMLQPVMQSVRLQLTLLSAAVARLQHAERCCAPAGILLPASSAAQPD